MNILYPLQDICKVKPQQKFTSITQIYMPDLLSARKELESLRANQDQAFKEYIPLLKSIVDLLGDDEIYIINNVGLKKKINNIIESTNGSARIFVFSPIAITNDNTIMSLILDPPTNMSNVDIIYITSNSEISEEYKSMIMSYKYDSRISLLLSQLLSDIEINDNIINIISSLEEIISPSVLVSKIYAILNDFFVDNNLEDQLIQLQSEMINTIPSMHIEKEPDDDIIGFSNMLEWITKRFKHKDKIVGERIKGILLIGYPGSGKSLMAKSLGKILNKKVIRYNPVSSFSGILGSSEENFRRDMKMIDALGDVIIFIDEIEKQLAGSESSNKSDGGSTSRAIQQFISWMQDRESDALIVATANSLDSLPKELLRSDRFDEIFFMDFPTEDERKQLINYYLSKYELSLDDDTIQHIINSTSKYTGSDIKNMLKMIKYDLLDNSEKTFYDIFERVIKKYKPFSYKFSERVKEIETNKHKFERA